MNEQRLKSECTNDIFNLMTEIDTVLDNVSIEEMESKDVKDIEEIYDIVYKLHNVVMEKLK